MCATVRYIEHREKRSQRPVGFPVAQLEIATLYLLVGARPAAAPVIFTVIFATLRRFWRPPSFNFVYQDWRFTSTHFVFCRLIEVNVSCHV